MTGQETKAKTTREYAPPSSPPRDSLFSSYLVLTPTPPGNIASIAICFVFSFVKNSREGDAVHRGRGDEVRAVGGEDGRGLAARGLRSEGVSAVGGGRGAVLLRLRPRVQDAQRPRPAQRSHVAGSSAGTYCTPMCPKVRGVLVVEQYEIILVLASG